MVVNTNVFHDRCLSRFVTGPPNLQDASGNIGKVPKVHINNDLKPELYHLVVYRALSATVCLFIEGEEDSYYFGTLNCYLRRRNLVGYSNIKPSMNVGFMTVCEYTCINEEMKW